MAEVGAFLKSRRARLSPDDVGLPSGTGYRRVAGLRREEIATLAGVSVDYYIRLEQGRSEGVSASVLDNVAAALRLSHDERDHLHRLARPVDGARRPAVVRPGLRQLLNAIGAATPAFLLGRRMDILAWNELAAALIIDFSTLPARERNLARLVLLHERVRQLYPDRELVVRNTAGFLRFDVGRHPDDGELQALIEELCARRPDFRQQWERHTVSRKRFGVKRFDHPAVGRFQLDYETLYHPEDEEQLLIVYSARPGTSAEQKLASLVQDDASAERARVGEKVD
jgi:transcriptional regulator with XRE-family HTH domain